jgi:hypothetical protein
LYRSGNAQTVSFPQSGKFACFTTYHELPRRSVRGVRRSNKFKARRGGSSRRVGHGPRRERDARAPGRTLLLPVLATPHGSRGGCVAAGSLRRGFGCRAPGVLDGRSRSSAVRRCAHAGRDGVYCSTLLLCSGRRVRCERGAGAHTCARARRHAASSGTGALLPLDPPRAAARARARAPRGCRAIQRALTPLPLRPRAPVPCWVQIRSASRMAAGASGSSKCCVVQSPTPIGSALECMHACMHACEAVVTGCDVLQSVLETAKEDVENAREQLQVPRPLRTQRHPPRHALTHERARAHTRTRKGPDGMPGTCDMCSE